MARGDRIGTRLRRTLSVPAVVVFAAVTLLLDGCAYLAEQNREYRRQHDLPPGSALIIHQPLPVAAGRRDVFIQSGRVVPSGAVDRYELYCELVLNHLSDRLRHVAPGRYEIEAAGPYIDRHGVRYGSVWYASLSIGGDPAPSPQHYGTRMQLRGPPGADTRELLCGSLYDPAESRYPTIAEIRNTLGALAAIEYREAE